MAEGFGIECGQQRGVGAESFNLIFNLFRGEGNTRCSGWSGRC